MKNCNGADCSPYAAVVYNFIKKLKVGYLLKKQQNKQTKQMQDFKHKVITLWGQRRTAIFHHSVITLWQNGAYSQHMATFSS